MGLLMLFSCEMYLPPKNIITDEDLMSSDAGLKVYMARLYSNMPWEDFKYMGQWGFNRSSWLGCLGIDGTGEAVNRDGITRAFSSEDNPWWGNSYTLIRDANKLITGIDQYADGLSQDDINDYKGQAYFVRAYSYYQMARRYGGVPLVTEVIAYPVDEDKLNQYRASEEDTWDQIASDFQNAADLMRPAGKFRGYANKYVALAFKAEAMLYAGSVAKYNDVANIRAMKGTKSGNTVIGFENGAAASVKYFAQAYKAASEVISDGPYSLCQPSDESAEAKYKNMVELFRNAASTEAILAVEYSYPDKAHGIDAYSSPYLWRYPLAGGTCPTADFVELFDGIEKHDDGTLKLTTGATNKEGTYLLFDSPMELFKDAEPRLRAYVILPMDEFRKTEIEVRTGIYTGTESNIPTLFNTADYAYANKEKRYTDTQAYKDKKLFMQGNPSNETVTVEVNGKTMNASGSCGPFYDFYEATTTGLYLRKYLDPDKSTADEIGEGRSDQPFILMRYADVLLAAAESAVELAIAGEASPVEGEDMLSVATKAIQDLQKRAGADVISSPLTGDEASRNIVRKERRKELAFEHKSKWDIRRWRVQHAGARELFWGEERDASLFSSNDQYSFRGLYPFYSKETGKYFFDSHFVNMSPKEFTYYVLDYYFEIPSGEVSKSAYLDQQPNR